MDYGKKRVIWISMPTSRKPHFYAFLIHIQKTAVAAAQRQKQNDMTADPSFESHSYLWVSGEARTRKNDPVAYAIESIRYGTYNATISSHICTQQKTYGHGNRIGTSAKMHRYYEFRVPKKGNKRTDIAHLNGVVSIDGYAGKCYHSCTEPP